jgi:hypothetical protein
MSNLKSTHLMMLTAALILAGCSSAASQESTNTAVVTQQGPDLMASLDEGAPVDDRVLDGAPSVIVPERFSPAPVEKPVVRHVEARLTCDIDIDRTSNGIRVTPVVRSDRALNGEYSLVITKSGSGGSSDISQGGPFDAARGERVALSASEFSMERGARFKAVLKVRAGGREICREISS